jgi:hypothetical protein
VVKLRKNKSQALIGTVNNLSTKRNWNKFWKFELLSDIMLKETEECIISKLVYLLCADVEVPFRSNASAT